MGVWDYQDNTTIFETFDMTNAKKSNKLNVHKEHEHGRRTLMVIYEIGKTKMALIALNYIIHR